MCLIASDSVKPLKVNSDGFCSAWKVVTKDNCSPYHGPGSNVSKHVYKIGVNISDVTIKPYIYNGISVYQGFHLFLNRKAARGEVNRWRDSGYSTKIIRVFYNPEDVIAYGYFECDNNVVVAKLTVKSLKGE